MNLVLDTLKSARSFRLLGHGLGVMAVAVLVRLNDPMGSAWAGAAITAAILAGLELALSLADRKARRLRAMAPTAFPFKNLSEEDRQFLQETLVRLPEKSAGRAAIAWVAAFLGLAILDKGADSAMLAWGLAALALGAPVSAVTQYLGNTVMGRRLAPFYYFEGDFADALSGYLPTLKQRMRLWLAAPLLALLPYPVLLSGLGLKISLSVWIWLSLWALAAGVASLRVFKDLVIDPIEDLGAALGRFGEGDFSALLDVTSGDALGVTTNRYNKTLRKIDRKLFVSDNFHHMVSGEKSEALFEGGLKLDGEEREVAVLAVSLSGPTMTLSAFNKFCTLVAECVDKHGGCLDEISHGLVVGVFNAPLKIENAEGEGLAAAAEVKERLSVFAAQQKMQIGLTLLTQVGFAYGKAQLGLAGPKGRQRYMALGGAADEARRLAAL